MAKWHTLLKYTLLKDTSMTVHQYVLAAILLAMGVFFSSTLCVQAYPPDATVMCLKGYSPETIRYTVQQQDRQEWREQRLPRRTVWGNIWRNVWTNNWIGSFDEFGNTKFRELP